MSTKENTIDTLINQSTKDKFLGDIALHKSIGFSKTGRHLMDDGIKLHEYTNGK